MDPSPPDDERGILSDPRLQKLVEAILTLASGDLSARVEPSEAGDELDAVITGVNLLAEELHYVYIELEERVDERTAMLLRTQAELEQLAVTDVLTGLPNRSILSNIATRAAHETAVIMVDLDSFKEINDTLGHDTGDTVLVEVSRRLKSAVRGSDVVARLGGDEFAILIRDTTEQEAVQIARRALDALQENVSVGDVSVRATASMGVSVGPPDWPQRVRDADIAMYEAKSRGRNTIQIFRPDMLDATTERAKTAAELRTALQRDELELVYQPVVDLGSGHAVGVEALVRWNHPTRGVVMPGSFIPIAEDLGLIVDLGRSVLEQAIAQMGAWVDEAPDLPAFTVHVNLSATELRRPGLDRDIGSCLKTYGVHPSRLVLEITETVLMTRGSEEARMLGRLNDLGVSLQIDDFGTGYSSISYLRDLPAQTVKVDQSLISTIDSDPDQAQFVEAILHLISSAGLSAVVEGVETARQAELLRGMGCPYAQGFYFSRPVPPERVLEVLAGFSAARG
ncbi:putative bifunctional diguanylate cyclase/phosphodiesterase [Sinomonas mesophila]|uniref:putative bifunctional diguanylate cyclase/phosphodiesterase n=1 Tax=Sinomonas mesophila TaxID=1531955 RepID=UPI0009848D4A|nr:bifunctional diguanylate cyclase/phosphodiesterase [Sinomonas mesophila]